MKNEGLIEDGNRASIKTFYLDCHIHIKGCYSYNDDNNDDVHYYCYHSYNSPSSGGFFRVGSASSITL